MPPKVVHDPVWVMILSQFVSAIDNIRGVRVRSNDMESTGKYAMEFTKIVTTNFTRGFEYFDSIEKLLCEKAVIPLVNLLNEVCDDYSEFANKFRTEYQKFDSILSLCRAIFRPGFDSGTFSRTGEKSFEERITELVKRGIKLNETDKKVNANNKPRNQNILSVRSKKLLDITLQDCTSYRDGNVISLANIKPIIHFILMMNQGMDGVSIMQGNSPIKCHRSNRSTKGGSQDDPNRGDFIKYFLKPFRTKTMSYYKRKADVISCEGGTKMLDYLRWVEGQLQREGELLTTINLYPLLSMKDVRGMEGIDSYYDELVVILLDTHRDKILGDVSHGFGVLMEKEDLVNAGLMYRMMEIIPRNSGVMSMHKCYRDYCQVRLKKMLVQPAPEESDVQHNKIMKKSMDDVMTFFHRQIETCKKSFNKAERMRASLSEATRLCINTDTLKEIFPHVLALFAASLMKREYEVGDDEASWIDTIILMFDCVNQKDVFQKEYQNQLGVRLLESKNIHTELERSFLSHLAKLQGHDYIHKMESMLTDCESSKTQAVNFMTEVRTSQEKLKGVEFSVKVLTAAQWPSYANDDIEVLGAMPVSLKECMEEFTRFYQKSSSANSCRLLDWKHRLGSGQATIAFPFAVKEVTASVYQIALLLILNDNGEMTVQELNERLGRSKSDTKSTMVTLASVSLHPSFRMVERVNEERKPISSKSLKTTDIVRLCRTFKHPSRKFTVAPERVAPETASSRDAEALKIEESRKTKVRITLIRIMKSRNDIEFRDLIGLASRQLADSFHVDDWFLKSQVETLITEKYIKRSDDDPKLLEYIS